MGDLDCRFFRKIDDVLTEIAGFSKNVRMSHARCRRRGSQTPPAALPKSPQAIIVGLSELFGNPSRLVECFLRASSGHSCLLFLFLVALTLSESLFTLSLSLPVSILSSQAGRPTFKHIDFVLTTFWGPLGVIFGGLGGVLEALWVLLGGSWELQVAPQLL